MIEIYLYYILYIFYALYAGWFIFSLFNIYHALKFGFVNYASYFMTFVFMGASIIVLFVTYQALGEVDWYYKIVF